MTNEVFRLTTFCFEVVCAARRFNLCQAPWCSGGGDFGTVSPDHPAMLQAAPVTQPHGAAGISHFSSAARHDFQAGVCLISPKAMASLMASGDLLCGAIDQKANSKAPANPAALIQPHHSPRRGAEIMFRTQGPKPFFDDALYFFIQGKIRVERVL